MENLGEMTGNNGKWVSGNFGKFWEILGNPGKSWEIVGNEGD